MTETILLVDDEEGIRRVLGISLADMGYAVITAENGEQALDIFARKKPPIVLTDIKMPGMDGIDLLRRLKSENPDVEVIVITGHGDMDLAIRSLKYEATDFITKPIDDDALGKALQKARERIVLRSQLRSYTENLEGLIKEKTDLLASLEGRPGAKRQEQYARLFDELPGFVTVHEADFRLSAANRAFQEEFKYRPESRAYCYEVFKGSDEPCLNCPVEQTFNDGRSHQQDLVYKNASGSRRNVFAWTTPLMDEAGAVSRVMMMATDISQIVDLKDHLASLGLMIGSVSHGIKGLLTGLDGAVYMLDSGVSKANPEQIDDGLKTVKQMAGRIKNMVLDILYYAKERELSRSRVDAVVFAGEVADTVEPKTSGKPIRLIRDFPENLKTTTLSVDATQLRAALVNILENAVDACEEDAARQQHTIVFSLGMDEKNRIVFDIRDDGIGMGPETQAKIFTLFFSSKHNRGTGIGLFISKKIVHQHGGEITVVSAPGQGARFRISIPLEEIAS